MNTSFSANVLRKRWDSSTAQARDSIGENPKTIEKRGLPVSMTSFDAVQAAILIQRWWRCLQEKKLKSQPRNYLKKNQDRIVRQNELQKKQPDYSFVASRLYVDHRISMPTTPLAPTKNIPVKPETKRVYGHVEPKGTVVQNESTSPRTASKAYNYPKIATELSRLESIRRADESTTEVIQPLFDKPVIDDIADLRQSLYCTTTSQYWMQATKASFRENEALYNEMIEKENTLYDFLVKTIGNDGGASENMPLSNADWNY